MIQSIIAKISLILLILTVTLILAQDSNELLDMTGESSYNLYQVPRRPFGVFGLRGDIGYGVYARGRGFGAHLGAAVGLGSHNRFGGYRGHGPFYG